MAGSTLIPTLRYHDAPAAIEWLCHAFGFERHLVVPDEGGKIAHAQLTFGSGMIMLGSVRDDAFGARMTTPRENGGKNTISPYVVVGDVDAHCARAREAGAEIVDAPVDQDYGGRFYSCLDCEGTLWCFGSYDPWQSPE